MNHRPSCVIPLLLVLLFVDAAAAGDYPEGNARVRLVASAGRAEPGGKLLLGVHFDIRPGWHIYWRNPGGAGLATDIQWRLPESFGAGPLQWPLPVYFTQSGDIPGYGYVGSVVLASEVSVPEGFDGTTSATVGAKVCWLACRDVCVIGDAILEGSLAKLAEYPVFATWREDLPGMIDASKAPFTLTTRGGLAEGKIDLWLRWQEAPQMVEWFPDPPESLKVDDVEVQTRGGLTRIGAVVQTMAGTVEKPSHLSSLVVMIAENGERRGWELAVELMQVQP